MKIGETYTGNHQHADMGNFQIYYKGILASDSGVYPTYGSEHHMYYTKSSVAHNTLSITSSTNPTGVQRMNRFGTDGYLDTTINTLEDLLQEKYVTGEVLGQEFGPDAYTPQYSYISGDIAAAYDENVQEAVRSMIFLPLDDQDHPAAFVVFDRITTSEAGSTKTFMLHTQSAPTINGNVTVIRNTLNGYNGELTNQTLLPYNASISSIGGEGKQYMVGDKNYDADRFDAAVIAGEAFEEGWGRVEVSTTTTGANQTDFFLNVMYVNDADQTYELVPAELIENGAVVGAKIFDRIALFNKTKERTDKTITFTVPADADVATYQVNVAGLQAGTWTVTNNGNTQTVVASEDGGIIYFEASAGECTLTWTSADAVKTFTENKPATNDGIDIQVDDMYLYTEVEPEFDGEDILVPVKTLFVAIGGTVEDTSIAYDDLRIILAANEVKTLSGDKLVASTTVVKEKDGEYLVSLSYLMDILDGYVWIRWDEFSSMISIDISQCTTTQLRGYYTIYTEEHTNVIPVHRAYQSGSETKATTILNAVDGDTMTRWATRGESGQAWAILDLAKVYKVDQVLISFYKGAERASSFAIEVSVDGINWTRALSHTTASGLSEDFESYDLKGAEARFIKYVGYGNTADAGTAAWNSVTEMLFIGTPKEGGILMPGFKDQSGLDQTQPGDSDGTNMEPGALLGSFGKIMLCIVVPVAILGIGGIVVFLICKKRNKKKVTEQ